MKDGEVWCAELSTGDADLDRQQNWSPEQWELLAENVVQTRQPWKPHNFRVSKYFDRNTKKLVTRPATPEKGQLCTTPDSKGDARVQEAEQGQWRYRYHSTLRPSCVNDHPGKLAEAAAKLASTQQPSSHPAQPPPQQSSALLIAVGQFPQLLMELAWPHLNTVEKLNLMAVCRQLAVLLSSALKVKHVTHACAFNKKQPTWVRGDVKILRISSRGLKHAEHVLWPMMLQAVLQDPDSSNGRKRRGAPSAAVSPKDHVLNQLRSVEHLQLCVHSLPTDTRAVWQALLPQMLPNCTRLQFTIPSRGRINTAAMCQANWAQVFASMSKLTHMDIVDPNFSQEMVLGAISSIPSLKVVTVDPEVLERVQQGVVACTKYHGQIAKHVRRAHVSTAVQSKKQKTQEVQDVALEQDLVYLVKRGFVTKG